MEFIDYMWLKFGVLCLAVIVYQFWRGLNGLPVQEEQPDTQDCKDLDRSKP